jgi:hypothetical protein
MRRKCDILCIAVLGFSTVAAAGWEIQGAYETLFPVDDLWEGQLHGADIRLVHWWDRSGLGLALSAGYMGWDVKQQTVYQSASRTHTIHGKASTLPLGISALVRGELPDHPNLLTTLEAGVRYLVLDSDMQVTETLDLGGGASDQETYSVNGEDGLVARIAAGLDLKIGEGRHPVRLYANIGYHFDLVKGEASESTWTGFSRRVGLGGTAIQLGLAIPIH